MKHFSDIFRMLGLCTEQRTRWALKIWVSFQPGQHTGGSVSYWWFLSLQTAAFSVSVAVRRTWLVAQAKKTLVSSGMSLSLTFPVFTLHTQALSSKYVLSLTNSCSLHHWHPGLTTIITSPRNMSVDSLVFLFPQWFSPRLFLIPSLHCLKLWWLLRIKLKF